MTNFNFGIKTNRFFVLMVFGKTGGEQFLGANGFWILARGTHTPSISNDLLLWQSKIPGWELFLSTQSKQHPYRFCHTLITKPNTKCFFDQVVDWQPT
jgi:hypothetical protein